MQRMPVAALGKPYCGYRWRERGSNYNLSCCRSWFRDLRDPLCFSSLSSIFLMHILTTSLSSRRSHSQQLTAKKLYKLKHQSFVSENTKFLIGFVDLLYSQGNAGLIKKNANFSFLALTNFYCKLKESVPLFRCEHFIHVGRLGP